MPSPRRATRSCAGLQELLAGELRGQKVLLFTYYKDTARYVYRELSGPVSEDWRASLGGPTIRRMDSGAAPAERGHVIERFAPLANGRPDLAGTPEEVDVLISTDVLSEGQNLQDCGVVVNYDLHWNPTRMVQRAGRVDRLLSPHEVIWIYNMFPDAGLEHLLGLVESLSREILDIDRTGFLDASVLGETVHPRNFNRLRRIRAEDGAVIAEEEEFAELASSEFLQRQLRAILDAGGRQALEDLPDGIHSGLARPGQRGVFFYFTAPAQGGGRQHFWHYYDLATGQVLDNRFLIANLIACAPDTPRVVGDADVFAIQEIAIERILRQTQEQRALEAAPKIVDPIQQTVATALRGYLNHPDVSRQELRRLIRSLQAPLPHVHLRALKAAYQDFSTKPDLGRLVGTLQGLPLGDRPPDRDASPSTSTFRREDLHLICFDHVCS